MSERGLDGGRAPSTTLAAPRRAIDRRRAQHYDLDVLLFDAPLTFREFMTHEEVPLAAIVRDVLVFLRTRPDAVLFGAQAVNAYCEPPRMTEDIDVFSTEAADLAMALSTQLRDRFHIAVRIREVANGLRLYQLRRPKNRHLVDIRSVALLPAHELIEGVRVVAPADLVALKAVSLAARRDREKGLSDRLDLARLLRVFPELREPGAPVSAKLDELGADEAAFDAWREAASHPLQPDDERDDDDDELV